MSFDPQNYKIIFFGTPDFSIPTLALLLKNKYQILAIVTQPDKLVGREQKLLPSPVKKFAQKNNIPILQPIKIRDNLAFYQELKKLKPDLCVVVAFGQIIPQNILNIPKFGFLNIHGSLLPKLRGASPMQAAILEDLNETGITLMKMDAGMDTGAILNQTKINLLPTTNISWLHDQLKELGADSLIKALPLYLEKKIIPQPQIESTATYCSLITKEMGQVDLDNDSAVKIYRKFRAYNPWPGVWANHNNTRLKLIEIELDKDKQLIIKKVLPAGKTKMTWEEYLRGNLKS